MAATVRPVWYHIHYEGEPDESGEIRPHILTNGADCFCEPKAVQVAPGIIICVHDPEDGLVLTEHKPRLDGL
jgi:hypothetical protein